MFTFCRLDFHRIHGVGRAESTNGAGDGGGRKRLEAMCGVAIVEPPDDVVRCSQVTLAQGHARTSVSIN